MQATILRQATRRCDSKKSIEGKTVRGLTRKHQQKHQGNIVTTHLPGESPKKSKLIPPGVEVAEAKLASPGLEEAASKEGGKAAAGGNGREAKGREAFAGEDFLAATVLDGDFPFLEVEAAGLAAGFLSPSSPLPLSLPEDLVGAFFTMVEVWKTREEV